MSPDWISILRVIAEVGGGVLVVYFGLVRQLWQKELAFRDRQIHELVEDMQALKTHVDRGTSRCSERTGQIQKGIGDMIERLVRLETLLDGDRRRSYRDRGANG